MLALTSPPALDQLRIFRMSVGLSYHFHEAVGYDDALVIRDQCKNHLFVFRDVSDQLKQGKVLVAKDLVRSAVSGGPHQALSKIHELGGELAFLVGQDGETDGGNDQADEQGGHDSQFEKNRDPDLPGLLSPLRRSLPLLFSGPSKGSCLFLRSFPLRLSRPHRLST
jgi:hypothetical protein